MTPTCKRGHPRTPADTYIVWPEGYPVCRACRRERAAEKKATEAGQT